MHVAETVVSPTIESLAPGLAVYKMPARAASAELVDDRGIVVGAIAFAADPAPALSPPKVIRLIHRPSTQGQRSFALLEVELDGALPAGALALVVADSDGHPR